MKRIPLILLILFFAGPVYSQELFAVTFSRGETFSFFSFRTDQEIIIRISDDGKLLEWGTDPGPGRFYYDSRKLQPYLGRVEYFGQDYDSAFRGKVKSIGTCTFTYYDKYEQKAKAGKLKTIGRNNIDYFDNYEDAALQGKIKLAGTAFFSYYASYENEAFRGKLKSVGNSTLTYYSTFDDKAIKGKIKSIGNFQYAWFSSYDRYQGGLKSGTPVQLINGVNLSLCRTRYPA